MSTERKINFGAGPARIPDQVLDKISSELHSYGGCGLSVLEISHRGPEFKQIINDAEKLLRELMQIPDNYEVLFMHGGGSGQFAAIPLNLKHLAKTEQLTADYLVTGAWSKKAAQEAQRYLKVNNVAQLDQYHSIPPVDQWNLTPGAAYLWYCANETIDGVEFQDVPQVPEGVNLVADISSNILSRPIDVSKHVAIIAGTQKNLGIGGLTLAIVRKDVLGQHDASTPSILCYSELAKNASLYNTPCVFAVYVTKLVLEWIKENGGVAGMNNNADTKAGLIYRLIDNSAGFYSSPIQKDVRSRMNVPFRINGGNADLEQKFVNEAKAQGMTYLKGHRSVGGIRASIYNAVTVAETETLAKFMETFRETNSK